MFSQGIQCVKIEIPEPEALHWDSSSQHLSLNLNVLESYPHKAKTQSACVGIII